MVTTELITRTEIQQYKQISDSLDNTKLTQLILEAQEQDLRPLLGESLYTDILINPDDYSDLLNGGSYTYQETTYINVGLKIVLACYVYARNVLFGDVTDTPFGSVFKEEQSSSRVDLKMKQTLYDQNREIAFNYFRNVEYYLYRTENALYKKKTTRRKTGLKITRVG